MVNRAVMHSHGRGGPVNYVAAIALYEQSILLGNSLAMNNRAFMHVEGHGGPVIMPLR